MDRDMWLKAMTQLSKLRGSYPVNNKTILFDGYDSHFDNHTLIHMEHRKIQPFILKEGDYLNDQPNDNGTN